MDKIANIGYLRFLQLLYENFSPKLIIFSYIPRKHVFQSSGSTWAPLAQKNNSIFSGYIFSMSSVRKIQSVLAGIKSRKDSDSANEISNDT